MPEGISFTRVAKEDFASLAPNTKPGTKEALAEYQALLADVDVEDGGEIKLDSAKKGTVKGYLTRAATLVGKKLKFFRTDDTTIRFQVTEVYDPADTSVKVEKFSKDLVPA
jgi:hypothetical protein